MKFSEQWISQNGQLHMGKGYQVYKYCEDQVLQMMGEYGIKVIMIVTSDTLEFMVAGQIFSCLKDVRRALNMKEFL